MRSRNKHLVVGMFVTSILGKGQWANFVAPFRLYRDGIKSPAKTFDLLAFHPRTTGWTLRAQQSFVRLLASPLLNAFGCKRDKRRQPRFHVMFLSKIRLSSFILLISEFRPDWRNVGIRTLPHMDAHDNNRISPQATGFASGVADPNNGSLTRLLLSFTGNFHVGSAVCPVFQLWKTPVLDGKLIEESAYSRAA